MSEEVQIASLDEVIAGEVETKTETVADKVVEKEEVKAEATVETETEDKTEVKEDAPTASDDKPVATIEQQLAAQITKAQDEKGKRQTLKAENEALRLQLVGQKKPDAPDAYAEPEKAIAFAKAELKQEFQDQLLNMSEQSAKARHSEDFDAMTDVFFNDMVKSNPALQAEALNQVDPYEFIYNAAKNQTELASLNEAGGVEGYRAKLEVEFRTKWDAEQVAKDKDAVEKAIDKSIPGSLSSKRAAGGQGTVKEFTGQTPLSKIIGR